MKPFVYLATGAVNQSTKDIIELLTDNNFPYYHFTHGGFHLNYDDIHPELRLQYGVVQADYIRNNLIGKAAKLNMSNLIKSDIFILVDPTGKGCQMEYGVAVARKIPTILCVTNQYEIGVMDYFYDHIVYSNHGLIQTINLYKAKNVPSTSKR